MGISYLGIRRWWDFIMDLATLEVSLRTPLNSKEPPMLQRWRVCRRSWSVRQSRVYFNIWYLCWNQIIALPLAPVLAFFTMSRSTTGTSSYILSKYSRSYPAKRTINKTQTQIQPGPETTSEWQHFTNPVIRLVLDVKTSSSTEIESVRLRIMWHINSDIENDSNNSAVAFASLFGFSQFTSGFILTIYGLEIRRTWISCLSQSYLWAQLASSNQKDYRSRPCTAILLLGSDIFILERIIICLYAYQIDDVDFFHPRSFTGLSSFPDILSVSIWGFRLHRLD